MIIVDASVAIKWFVEEEQRGAALDLLTSIKNNPSGFAVPDFFFIEMMSVLVRFIRKKGEMEQVIDDLFDLGMLQLRLGNKLLKGASRFAIEFNLSGYDALYASCAEALKGVWLTADVKAHKKIKSLGISRSLGDL